MARSSRSPFAKFALVVFALLWLGLSYTFSQIYGNGLADQVDGLVGFLFGMSAQRVSAVLSPYIIPGGGALLIVLATFQLALLYVRHTEFAEDPKANALTLTPMHVTDIAEHLLDRSAWGWRERLRLTLKSSVKGEVAREMTRAGRDFDVRFIGTPP